MAFADTQRVGKCRMIERQVNARGFARQVEFGKADRAGAHLHRTAHRAHLLLQHADHVDIIIVFAAITLGDRNRSADGRMAGEGQFARRCKDTQRRRMGRVTRTIDENGLERFISRAIACIVT